MDCYFLHLAMAALVGAFSVVISAYFLHRKKILQLLDFARTISDVISTADGEEKLNGPVTVRGIPTGLPQLHAVHEGIYEPTGL
jgi:hypothetical protein